MDVKLHIRRDLQALEERPRPINLHHPLIAGIRRVGRWLGSLVPGDAKADLV